MTESIIKFRGSVTDLATDVAGNLTIDQARTLVKELHHFLDNSPAKFRSTRTTIHDGNGGSYIEVWYDHINPDPHIVLNRFEGPHSVDHLESLKVMIDHAIIRYHEMKEEQQL